MCFVLLGLEKDLVKQILIESPLEDFESGEGAKNNRSCIKQLEEGFWIALGFLGLLSDRMVTFKLQGWSHF